MMKQDRGHVTKEHLTQFLKHYIEITKKEQQEIAWATDLQQSRISEILSGKAGNPSSKKTESICNGLSCTVQDIANFDPKYPHLSEYFNRLKESVSHLNENFHKASPNKVKVSSSWSPFRMNANVRERAEDRLIVTAARRKMPKLKR